MYVQVQWADDWAVCAVDIPDAKCHWYVMSPDNTFGEGFDWEEAPWFDANGLNDIAPMQETGTKIMIYEYDFFDHNQLRQILSIFDSGKFVDGARTGSKDKFVKDNTQQEDIELNKMANDAITKILRDLQYIIYIHLIKSVHVIC